MQLGRLKCLWSIAERPMYRTPLKDRRSELFAIIILCEVVFLLYGENLFGFWRYDDTQILLHAIRYNWWEYFFIPKAWQVLSSSNLTPWLSLSFDLDLFLFGLNPAIFYLHHLLSLTLVAVATFFLLILWIDKHWAFFGVLLFIVGAPVAYTTHQLMTRHYLEGLFFSIMAVYLCVHYTRKQKYNYIIGAALFYALAISAKEIYVPLGLLLLFMQRDKICHQFRLSISSTLPFILIILLYVLWRHYMLDSMISGYGDSSEYLSLSYWKSVLIGMGKILPLLTGRHWPLFVTLYIMVILTYFFVYKNKALLTLFCLFTVLIPLVPLVQWPGITAPNRYLLLVWYMICISFTYFISCVASTTKKTLWFVCIAWLLIFGIVFNHTQIVAKSLDRAVMEFETQMRFAWEHDDHFSFIPTKSLTSSFWAFTGLSEIKTLQNQNATSPNVMDNLFLYHTKKLFEYDISCQCMRDISTQIDQRIIQSEMTTRKHAPLSLQVTNNQGVIRWTFGPYNTGQYWYVSERGGKFQLPASGIRRSNPTKKYYIFYLLYVSPDGWKTYSPKITLFPDGKPVHWKRANREANL